MLKGRHIRFPEVTHGNIGQVGCMAGIFRTAMYGIMLGTGPQLTVFGGFRSLQATNHSIAHDGSQVGVFSVGLLSPAPPWVTENIDIRRPYRQRAHLHILTAKVIHPVVILGTELRRGNIEALIQQVGIERRSHCNRFWKHSDITHVGSTV